MRVTRAKKVRSIMQKSMQTHFEGGTLGIDLCTDLVSKGVTHFRMSGGNSNLDQCNAMLAEADMAGANHLLTLSDTKGVDLLKQIHNRNIEWGNEPDGDITPNRYWETFLEAYDICQTNGNKLHGPAISNLDRDSLNWLEFFVMMGIPQDVIITYHHYTPNMFFWQSHTGFQSRQEEINALRKIARGRKIACSESGYNDADESRQATNTTAELMLAKGNGLEFWTYYQIGDDPNHDEHFGARRVDGSWKPVIDSFSVTQSVI